MIPLVTFWVPGKARPKGSMKCNRDRQHTMREQVDNKAWRRAVGVAARAAWGGAPAIDYPVEMWASIFYIREIGVAGKVKPSHSTPFPVAPEFGDSDKLARLINDALQDARVLVDDNLVIRCVVGKYFATEDGPGGAQISLLMPEPLAEFEPYVSESYVSEFGS